MKNKASLLKMKRNILLEHIGVYHNKLDSLEDIQGPKIN